MVPPETNVIEPTDERLSGAEEFSAVSGASRSSEKDQVVSHSLIDYYRCPEEFGAFALTDKLCEDSRYFKFGPDTICYGQVALGSGAALEQRVL